MQMRFPSSLILGLLMLVGPLLGQGRGKSAPAVREKSFEIIQNFPVNQPLFPFAPEDLAELRQPTHPAHRLEKHLQAAIQRFEGKNGRSPSNDLEVAVAITDWVAATMLHPSFYPSFGAKEKYYPNAPSAFLMTYPSAIDTLEYILKFNPRDRKQWPSPYCDHQNNVVGGLLSLAGLYSQTVGVSGHTGLQFFSWDYGKWIWCEATFNEHYLLVEPGRQPLPLGVMDLHNLTNSKQLDKVRVVKHGYPDTVYLNTAPDGFRRFVTYQTPWFSTKTALPAEVPRWAVVSLDPPLTSATDKWVPGASPGALVPPDILNAGMVHDPSASYQKLDAIGLSSPIAKLDEGIRFSLRTLLPYTASFEITRGLGDQWIPMEATPKPGFLPAETRPITLTWDSGLVRIRAVDTFGNHSQEFIIRMTP